MHIVPNFSSSSISAFLGGSHISKEKVVFIEYISIMCKNGYVNILSLMEYVHITGIESHYRTRCERPMLANMQLCIPQPLNKYIDDCGLRLWCLVFFKKNPNTRGAHCVCLFSRVRCFQLNRTAGKSCFHLAEMMKGKLLHTSFSTCRLPINLLPLAR